MAARTLYISQGLSVVRFATPEQLGDITDGLDYDFGNIPGVEVRQFAEEDEDSNEPAIQLVNSKEVRSRGWPEGRLLDPILDRVEQDLPRLTEPLTVNFASVGQNTNRRGETFIYVEPDDDSYRALASERNDALRTIERAARVPHDQSWKRGHLDMTLVYADEEVPRHTTVEIGRHIGTLLPLQIEMSGIEFFPDPRFDNN